MPKTTVLIDNKPAKFNEAMLVGVLTKVTDTAVTIRSGDDEVTALYNVTDIVCQFVGRAVVVALYETPRTLRVRKLVVIG